MGSSHYSPQLWAIKAHFHALERTQQINRGLVGSLEGFEESPSFEEPWRQMHWRKHTREKGTIGSVPSRSIVLQNSSELRALPWGSWATAEP